MSQKRKRKTYRTGTINGIQAAVSQPAAPTESPAVVPPVSDPITDENYQAHRSCLIEIENKQAEQHDKAVLQVAMGALGVSVTFMEKIAPNPLPSSMPWLFAAWSFLVVSVGAIIGSFLLSQYACRKERDWFDEDFKYERTSAQIEALNRNNWQTRWVIRVNVCAYITFVLGVAFLLVFSAVNMVPKFKENLPVIQTPANPPREDRGAAPPKAPARPASPIPPKK